MGWMVERSPRFPAAAVLLCEVGLGSGTGAVRTPGLGCGVVVT